MDTYDRLHMKQRGFMLLTSYLLLTMATILSAAFYNRVMVFMNSVERNHNRIIAFQQAEAGVDQTIQMLKSNANYTGSVYSGLGSKGGYQVTVSAPSSDVRLIESFGYSPSNIETAKAYERRSLNTYVRIDSTPFNFAAFGELSVQIDGSSAVIDSYDSRLGSYGGINIGIHGDLASDGTVTFNGNAIHLGQVVQNPNRSCLPGASQVTSSGTLNLSGSSVYTLSSGTYHFDSISISGNARIDATGPVTIYVDGAVSLGGNGVATSNNIPGNFIVIATGSGDVSVSGSAAFYGGIYAPSSSVNNNASDFFGSIISNNYQHNGSTKLHYDEAMADIPAPCYDVEVLAWNEESIFSHGY